MLLALKERHFSKKSTSKHSNRICSYILKIKLPLNFGVDETLTKYKPLSMGFIDMTLVRNRLEILDRAGNFDMTREHDTKLAGLGFYLA